MSKPDLSITPDQEMLDVSRLFTLVDLDKEYYNCPHAVIVNKESLISKKLSKEFTDAVYSGSDGDLGFVDTCECGAVRGATKRGMYCQKCGTVCSSEFVDHLKHVSWVEIPSFMPPVMHPVWFQMLKGFTGVNRGSSSIIDIILNPKLPVPEALEPYIRGRGFQYFYEHIDEILDMIFYEYPKTKTKPNVKSMIAMRKEYRNCMFTRHMPILHSSLHTRKRDGDSLYYLDQCSRDLLGVLIDSSVLDLREHITSMSFVQSNAMMYDVYMRLMEYYKTLISFKLGKKEGILRKHVFGSRIHFSFRTVIVSQSDARPLDEILLPWGQIVAALKLPLMNFLVHRHYKSMEEALLIITHAIRHYDPLVDECLKAFIYECPDHQLPIVIGRNPTLAYGSIIQVYARDYKRDPEDETISLNACIIKPANADFDGDEMYGFFIFENWLKKALSAVHPSQLMFNTTNPGLASRVGLIDQNWIVMLNWLREEPNAAVYEEL